MVEETLKRYADDITVQELVRLRVENDKLKERIETLQEVVRENHDSTLEIFKEREQFRGYANKARLALNHILNHPVEESKQWEVAVREMKKLARDAFDEDN